MRLPALGLLTLAALALAAGADRWSRLGQSPLGSGDSLASQRELASRATAAEELMTQAEKLVRSAKMEAGMHPAEGLTAGDSAFLGDELTPLVTTLGSLESKRLAAIPLWAAALTYKLHQAGIREGDVVAASFSGSFPALNIALLAACSVLKARVVAISSITASTWGANQPGFTWPEIEARLVQSGLLGPASVAITLGGDDDRAEDLEPSTRIQAESIQHAAARALGAEAMTPASLRQSIDRRMLLYRQHASGRLPALYVNIGGSAASLGASLAILRQRSGFLRALPFDLSPDRGIIARFTEMGVPVLNLLNIRDLAFRWNIP